MSSTQVLRLATFVEALDPTAPAEVVRAFTDAWRQALSGSELRSGCAVAAVALAGGPALRPAVDTVLRHWRSVLAAALQRAGQPAAPAARLAATVLAGVEGALLMARADQDISVFDAVADDLVAMAELTDRRG